MAVGSAHSPELSHFQLAGGGMDVMAQIMAEVGRRRNSIVTRSCGDDSDEWEEE